MWDNVAIVVHAFYAPHLQLEDLPRIEEHGSYRLFAHRKVLEMLLPQADVVKTAMSLCVDVVVQLVGFSCAVTMLLSIGMV